MTGDFREGGMVPRGGKWEGSGGSGGTRKGGGRWKLPAGAEGVSGETRATDNQGCACFVDLISLITGWEIVKNEV